MAQEKIDDSYKVTVPHATTRRRSCCPTWLRYTTLILIAVILIITIPIAVVYLNARPKRPSFHITTLNITQFNFTTTIDDITHLNSNLNFTISIRNSNKDAVFYYDSIDFSVCSNGVFVGNGSLGAGPFTQGNKTSNNFQSSISNTTGRLSPEEVNVLKTDVYKDRELYLTISLRTSVRVKMGGKMRKKVGFHICCSGIRAVPDYAVSDGYSTPTSSSSWEVTDLSAAKCCITNLPIFRFK